MQDIMVRGGLEPPLKYTLRMSSKFGGPPNAYGHLITDDDNMGAGTNSEDNAYIEAYLGTVKYVERIEVKGCGQNMQKNMYGGWGCDGNTNVFKCVVEYK
eukprot:147526_1